MPLNAKYLSLLICILFLFFKPAPAQDSTKILNARRDVVTAIDDTSRINALNMLSLFYHQNNDNIHAVYYADSELKLSQRIRWKKGTAMFYATRARIYSDESKYDTAKDYYMKSMAICEEIGFKLGAAKAYNNIAIIYQSQSDYSNALEYYFKSLRIRDEVGDTNGVAMSYNNIGDVCRLQHNNDSALQYFKKSLEINLLRKNKLGIALCYGNLGEVYAEENHYDEALKYFILSKEIFRVTDSLHPRADLDNFIGTLLLSLITADDSIKRSSLNLLNQNGADPGLHKVSINQILIDSSFSFHSRALRIAEKANDRPQMVPGLLEIGYVYMEKKNYGRTIAYDLKAALIADSLHLFEDYSKAAYSLYECYRQLGNYPQSLHWHEIFLEVRDSVNNAANQKAAITHEMQYNFDKTQLAQQQEQEKKDAVAQAELQKQKFQKYSLIIIAILFIALAGLGFYRFREKKRDLATLKETQSKLIQLEKLAALEKERQRISRDMHDELGSGISMISMMSDLIKREQLDPVARDKMEKISSVSAELVQQMREIVWTLNPQNDNLKNLLVYLRQYAINFFSNTPIDCIVKMPEKVPECPVNGELRRTLFLVTKESLNNLLKHARAKKALVDIYVIDHRLQITISDDGIGIIRNEVNPFGNGLKNMQKRMEEINGKFEIYSVDGTVIKLVISLSSRCLNE